MDDESIALLQSIAKVRRSTSNGEVVTICNALESRLLVRPALVSAPEQSRPRFDKGKYMRAYMAKRRAEARKLKGAT